MIRTNEVGNLAICNPDGTHVGYICLGEAEVYFFNEEQGGENGEHWWPKVECEVEYCEIENDEATRSPASTSPAASACTRPSRSGRRPRAFVVA